MIFAILLFNVTHPGTILFGQDSDVPSLRQTFRERGRKEFILLETTKVLRG